MGVILHQRMVSNGIWLWGAVAPRYNKVPPAVPKSGVSRGNLQLPKIQYYTFDTVNCKWTPWQSGHKFQEHFQFKTLKFGSNSNTFGKSSMSFSDHLPDLPLHQRNIRYSGVNCALGQSKSIRYSGVRFHIFYCSSAGLSNGVRENGVFVIAGCHCIWNSWFNPCQQRMLFDSYSWTFINSELVHSDGSPPLSLNVESFLEKSCLSNILESLTFRWERRKKERKKIDNRTYIW